MVNIVSYVIFYTAFLIILLAVSVYMPVEIISGISQDDLNVLKENVSLPPEPTIADYFIFPFTFIYSILNKAIILILVSTAHQFIAVVLTPFTIGFIWVIMKMIRGN